MKKNSKELLKIFLLLYVIGIILAGAVWYVAPSVLNLARNGSSTTIVSQETLPPAPASVLSNTAIGPKVVNFNVETVFKQPVTFESDIVAPNVIYSITSGAGVGITAGQTPTISNTGVLSLQGQTGVVSLTAGSGIGIEGTTITNTGITSIASGTGISVDGNRVSISLAAGDGISVDGNKITNNDRGSSQSIFKTFAVDGEDNITASSNTDTLTFVEGTGIILVTDPVTKKITITANANDSELATGWERNVGAGTVYLQQASDSVGVGTTTPSYKLDVIGTGRFTGAVTLDSSFSVAGATNLTSTLSVGGSTTLSSTLNVSGLSTLTGINNQSGGITNAGSITGATGLTSTGTITFGGLTTGIVKANASGVLSSAAVNLTSADVTGTLPATSGGTGTATYTTGDMLYASASNTLSKLAIGGNDQVLTVAGGLPTWATITVDGSLCPTCIVNNPGSTQTITPTAGTATGLEVRQASGGSVDIFSVTSNDGATKYFRVDSTGAIVLGSSASSGVFTVNPSGTDPLSISPGAQGVAAFTGTITSADLTAARTYTLPDTSGTFCLTSGNCVGTSSGMGGSGTSNYVARFNSQYVIEDSSIYDNGNVGIGTTNPLHKLSVVGTTNITGATTLGSTLNVTGATVLSSTLNVSGGGATSLSGILGVTGATTLSSTLNVTGLTTIGGNLNVNGAGTSYITGNVGIGTSTPDRRLDVTSTGNAIIGRSSGASSIGVYGYNTSTSGVNYGLYGQAVGTNALGTNIGSLGVSNGSGLRNVGGSFYATTGTHNIDLMLGTTSVPTASYSLYSEGTAASYFAGNVGIGTSIPAQKLDVNGTIKATGITSSGTINFSGLSASSAVYTDGSSNLTTTAPTSGAVGYWSRTGTALSPTTSGDTLSLAGTINTSAGYTQTGTSANTFTGTSTFSNATYSALFTGGNVGIGVTAPGAKLQVDSSPNIGTVTSTTTARNYYSTYIPTGTMTPGAISSTLSTYGLDQVVDTSNLMTGDTTDGQTNVRAAGLNTSISGSPTFTDITGTNPSFISAIGAQHTVNVSPIQTGSNGEYYFSSFGEYITNSSSNSDSAISATAYGIYAQLTGNLTNGDHYGGYFNVTGTAGTNTGLNVFATNATTNNRGAYLSASGGTNATALTLNAFGATNNKALYIVNPSAASSNNYSIYSEVDAQSYFAGNIGIGSTAPSHKLDVAGSIKTTGGYYNNTDFPTNVEITRTIPTTVNDYVEIGQFNGLFKPNSFRITITGDSDVNVSKQYIISTIAAATANTWYTAIPFVDSTPFGSNNFAMDIKVGNSGSTVLRLRRTVGTTAGTAKIRIEALGDSLENTFYEYSNTGSDTAPTQYYGGVYQSALGNVGIGTVSPAGLFDVNGKFTVLSGGNVGIGSTTPGMKLDVNGDARVASGSDFYVATIGLNDNGSTSSGASLIGLFDDTMTYVSASTNVQSAIKQLDTAIGGVVAGTRGVWTDAGTYLYPTSGEVLGNSTTAGSNKLTGAYFADSAPLYFGTDNDINFTFSGTTLAATMGNNDINFDANTLFIDGSANNVGIGSTVPGANLDVTGTGRFSSTLTASNGLTVSAGGASILGTTTINTTGTAATSIGNSTGVLTLASGGSSAWANTAGTLAISTVTSGDITLTTGAATGLANILTGNLKVGNGTPGVTLNGEDAYIEGTFEVDGAAQFDGTATFNGLVTENGQFTLGDGGDTGAINTSDWDIDATGVMTGISGITTNGGYTQSGTTANTFTGTSTFSNATYSALFTGGNVGIGTSTPSQLLEVSKAQDTDTVARITNTDPGTSARAIFQAQNDSGTGSVFFGITGTGYTGISGWQDSGVISASNAISGGLVLNTQAGGIKFQYQTSEKMRIDTAGNVGIGSTAPASKLSVISAVNHGTLSTSTADTYGTFTSVSPTMTFSAPSSSNFTFTYGGYSTLDISGVTLSNIAATRTGTLWTTADNAILTGTPVFNDAGTGTRTLNGYATSGFVDASPTFPAKYDCAAALEYKA